MSSIDRATFYRNGRQIPAGAGWTGPPFIETASRFLLAQDGQGHLL